MAFKPHGIVVPIVTPVTQDGKFNEKAYRDLIEYLASSGIHGVFPFGTTGEFYAHDMGFYREVLAVTKDAVRGRMDIYAGANNITTRGAVEIASETNLPIIIYNNRPKTNVTVEPATVAKLAEIDNIIGVKDSTGDMTNTEEYLRLTRGMDNFHVMMGRDTLIYAALCYGASGAIASCANVAPRIAVDIYEKFRAGDAAGALDAQFRFSALRIATNMGTFPVVLKEALKLIGHDCGDCVKPIQPLNDEQRARLKTVLTDMGLL